VPPERLHAGPNLRGLDGELVLVDVDSRDAALAAVRDLPAHGAGFGVLLACDASAWSVDEVSALVRPALLAGMHWFSAWGPGCERVHDIVDGDVVDLGLDEPDQGDVPFGGHVMTTWHDDEPLAETLEFFWTCSSPSGDQTDSGLRLVLTVGLPAAADEVRGAAQRLDDP
jgi:hypothetical protein